FKQFEKLTPSDIAENDFFGRSVGISANGFWAVLGSPGDDDNGASSGSVYVFIRSNGRWIEQAKLLAEDGAGQDSFGENVAISANGEYVIVGASRDDDGASDVGSTYIFHRNGSTWKQQAKLVPSDPEPFLLFGDILTLSQDGSFALVGVINDEENGMLSGSAYVFWRDGSRWIQQAKLVPQDGAIQDFFGLSVALNHDGSLALIGAQGDDDNGSSSGSVYVFERIEKNWSEQTKIQAGDAAVGDLFGSAVSLSADGKHAVITAPFDDDGANGAGSAYYFELQERTWVERLKLMATDPSENTAFGQSITISADGTIAVVGSPFDAQLGEHAGSAYAFGGKTLPVELTTFTATASENRVLLQWVTASELNNAGFHIEQFIDTHWTELAFITGAGTIDEVQRYRHSISNLHPGHYRFRLKQVDFDGSSTYSPEAVVTVGVSGRYDLRLAGPHPVRNQASWVLTLPVSQSIDVSVYNILGRRMATLYTGHLSADLPLRLEWKAHNAASGMYLVNVVGESFHSTHNIVLAR
ncbi:MAG: FG-GAP repeat protein, partial [Pseudomonadota bacterium]